MIRIFFIGIFGIQDKTKKISTESAIICPICERYGRYDIVKRFTYFHIFFIPLWRWNKRYFIQSQCCSRICELEPELGARIESGESMEITREQLLCDDYHIEENCPNCTARVEQGFQYCPHCGSKLKSS